MTLAVDQPIINDPYQEPTRWWDYQQGQPVLMDGRRPAGYYMAPRTRARAGAVAQEEFVRLESVNEIRARVTRWREAGYPGTTQLTRELLRHWNSPEREGRHRLFYCQREAAESIIWMIEGPERDKRGLDIPTDAPQDAESIEKGYRALRRYCCKMATASGKTVVMAMIIAWSAAVLSRGGSTTEWASKERSDAQPSTFPLRRHKTHRSGFLTRVEWRLEQ